MFKKIVLTLLTFSSIMINAQESKQKLPGDTSLPSSKEELQKVCNLETGTYKYSVNDYFKKPKQSSFQFSPNGKYLSYKEKDTNGKNHMYIKNIETDKVIRAIEK